MREERLNKLFKHIHNKKFVSIQELCKTFNISVSTLRRDLDKITKDPKYRIKKIYGGVSSIDNNLQLPNDKKLSNNLNHEELIDFKDRSKLNIQEKNLLSAYAAKFITDDDVIYIDSGTTLKNILNHINLKNITNLTIITNNADVINFVINNVVNSAIRLIVAGNIFHYKTRSFSGGSIEDVLSRFNVNKAFMSSTGISLKSGITNSSFSEFELKKYIIDKATKKFLVINNNKFNHAGLLTYAGLNNITDLITYDEPEQKYIDFFKQHKIKLHIINNLKGGK